MTRISGEESHGFTFTWNTSFVGACAGFTLHHYVVSIDDAGTPASPSVGDRIGTAAAPTITLYTHRAQRTYYAKIWACDDASCSDVFGSAGGELVAAATDSLDTAQEEWVLVGEDTPEDAVGIDAFNSSANDVASVVYPAGFTWDGYIGLWGHDNTNKAIQYATAAIADWPNYNTISFSPATEVLGSHDTDTDYDAVSHAFPFPVYDGSDERIYLLAQNFDTTAQVVSALSNDDAGADFGSDFTCASCCYGTGTECDWSNAESYGEAGVELDPTSYLFDTFLHGRWLWHTIADGVPDLTTDTPSILLSGEPGVAADGCSNVGWAMGDIYKATWNGSAWIPYDGADAGTCPDAVIEDAHDPGITPLPNGEFKVYVVDSSHNVVAHYIDAAGNFEADTSTPLIRFDDSVPTTISHKCVANLDSFVMLDGSPHEGMFLYVHLTGIEFQTGPADPCDHGVNIGGGFDPDASRMFFAELQN